MSIPHIPTELLDHIVDFLYDSKDALKSCSLVSKSWIPTARKHLFARVEFRSNGVSLQSWKDTFPDPSTSPARYTEVLVVECPEIVTEKDAEEGGWIRTFSRVVHLEVKGHRLNFTPDTPLILFRGFSPVLRSLRITSSCPSPQMFDLICSFPLLKDLAVFVESGYNSNRGSEESNFVYPSASPAFTGSLLLSARSGMNAIAGALLAVPSGLHFRRMELTGSFWDDSSTETLTALIEKCRDTLESITLCGLMSYLIDFSRAPKLKDITFHVELNPRWIIEGLRTIAHNHQNLREVSISTTYASRNLSLANHSPVQERVLRMANAAWLELDRLLAELWESHQTRVKVAYYLPGSVVDREKARTCMENLVPEIKERGIVEFIETRFPMRVSGA